MTNCRNTYDMYVFQNIPQPDILNDEKKIFSENIPPFLVRFQFPHPNLSPFFTAITLHFFFAVCNKSLLNCKIEAKSQYFERNNNFTYRKIDGKFVIIKFTTQRHIRWLNCLFFLKCNAYPRIFLWVTDCCSAYSPLLLNMFYLQYFNTHIVLNHFTFFIFFFLYVKIRFIPIIKWVSFFFFAFVDQQNTISTLF